MTQPLLQCLVLLKSFEFLQSFPLIEEEMWRYRGSKRKTSQDDTSTLCSHHVIMYSIDKQTNPNSLHFAGMSWPQQETTGWFEGCISQHYWALSYHLCRLQHISCLGILHSPGASSSSPWVQLCASGSPGDCSVPLQRKWHFFGQQRWQAVGVTTFEPPSKVLLKL